MLTRRIAISACALCLAIPAAAGASPTTDPPNARGPYGVTPATLPHTVKAKGPYGVTTAAGSSDTAGATARAGGASGRDGANGWRTAAIFEAALLAALALGSALLLLPRRRAARVVA